MLLGRILGAAALVTLRALRLNHSCPLQKRFGRSEEKPPPLVGEVPQAQRIRTGTSLKLPYAPSTTV